ncbi:MAG: M20/M25/M40 family metallo-hydrolase [Bacteroidia bacterium]
MKRLFTTALLAGSLSGMALAQTPEDSVMLRRLFDAEITQGTCYENLRHLCKDVGHRLSGSPNAAKAVEWAAATMNTMGLDRVEKQPVLVPHWERGKADRAWYKGKMGKVTPPILALGSSVGTPNGKAISAPVVEVFSLDEVRKMEDGSLKGKIVFYNRPMNAKELDTFDAYGGCVDQRGGGSVEASKKGALAVIVRSMTLQHDDHPHTGNMRNEEGTTKIPAAAISTNGADRLHEDLKNDPNLVFSLQMGCQTFPDAPSHNVIGEIKGSALPNEFITVGGHLDSWDVGEGAHDDGTGVVQAMEVLKLFRMVGYQPRHTIRAVAFMNEENGMKGGLEYAAQAKAKGEKHIAALESDRGGFSPRGVEIQANPENTAWSLKYKPLFIPYMVHNIQPGYGGVDISPLRAQGAGLYGYLPDSQRYFDFHHAETDVFEAVNERELKLGAWVMAAWIYLIDQYGLPSNEPYEPPK